MNDDGTFNDLMKLVVKRFIQEEVVIGGTSAGAMVMCSPIFGMGSPYGYLYFE